MSANQAPVLIGTYVRVEHLAQTIEALKKNEIAQKTELFIASDHPSTPRDIVKVAEVRLYIHTITGFRTVH